MTTEIKRRRRHLSCREAGALGGTATLERHGVEHFQKLGQTFGRLGGRPRSKTWLQIQAERALLIKREE